MNIYLTKFHRHDHLFKLKFQVVQVDIHLEGKSETCMFIFPTCAISHCSTFAMNCNTISHWHSQSNKSYPVTFLNRTSS